MEFSEGKKKRKEKSNKSIDMIFFPVPPIILMQF
jgi:hypothetical protein